MENRLVVHLPNGPVLVASDIFLALSGRGVGAVVVHNKGIRPLAATDENEILFVAARPKTANDLSLVRVAGGWVEHLFNGPSRTAEEITQAIGEGAIVVVLYKGDRRSLEIDDIFLLARPIDPTLLAVLQTMEEYDTRAEKRVEEHIERLAARVVAWAPNPEEPPF